MVEGLRKYGLFSPQKAITSKRIGGSVAPPTFKGSYGRGALAPVTIPTFKGGGVL